MYTRDLVLEVNQYLSIFVDIALFQNLLPKIVINRTPHDGIQFLLLDEPVSILRLSAIIDPINVKSIFGCRPSSKKQTKQNSV